MVQAALPAYMDQEGWGVVMLLVSLLLTRGVHVVRKVGVGESHCHVDSCQMQRFLSRAPHQDMDEAANALMGMHGYCTQELVNLILAGKCRIRAHTTQWHCTS